MRDNVMEHLGQEVVSWNNIKAYQEFMTQFNTPGYQKHTFTESIDGLLTISAMEV